jgi:hypothetical protein
MGIVQYDLQPLFNIIKNELQELAEIKGRPMRLNSILFAINFISEFVGEKVNVDQTQIDDLANEIGSRLRACTLNFTTNNSYPFKKDIADFVMSLDNSIVEKT